MHLYCTFFLNREIISTRNEIGKPDFVKIGLQFPGNESVYSIPWGIVSLYDIQTRKIENF